jgi:sterol desaturase/sphingolipid hydroxylase (fatty acid hydroxylase superfamily)
MMVSGADETVMKEMAMSFFKHMGRMFYLVDPAEFMNDSHVAPQYISDAIPYFVLFVLVEYIFSRVKKGETQVQYNAQETMCSISLGLVQQTGDILLRGVALYPYVYVYENFRLFDIPLSSTWAYVALFLGVDFGYYLMHRSAHVYHFMWIGHSVHHSGEYYNFATALRQGTTQAVYSRFFYLPLAFLGFPFAAYMGHNSLNTLYQFWIHTEIIDKLGPLEVIFNTPSHHRMHHRPPGNCNYAGVLIIWDRIFGTFVEEKERRDVYGLAKPLGTFNPLLANYQHALRMMGIKSKSNDDTTFTREGGSMEFNFSYFLSIFFTHRHNHRFVFKPLSVIEAFFSPTAWSFSVPFSSPLKTREKYGTSAAQAPILAVKIYTFLNFLLTLLLLLQVLLKHRQVQYYHAVLLMIIPIWSLMSIGMLNECNPYSLKVETRRVLVVSCWLVMYSLLKTLSYFGYGYQSGNAIAGVMVNGYVMFLESPFYLDDNLLTAPLSFMYAVMIFTLWIVTRRKIRAHFRIVSEPTTTRSLRRDKEKVA